MLHAAKLHSLTKLKGIFTNSKVESVQTLLEIHHLGEQGAEVGEKELAVFAKLSARKCVRIGESRGY